MGYLTDEKFSDMIHSITDIKQLPVKRNIEIVYGKLEIIAAEIKRGEGTSYYYVAFTDPNKGEIKIRDESTKKIEPITGKKLGEGKNGPVKQAIKCVAIEVTASSEKKPLKASAYSNCLLSEVPELSESEASDLGMQ